MQRDHTDQLYETELRGLHTLILRMGAKVEEMLAESMKALVHQDVELAKNMIEFDHQINRLEVDIDELCLVALAKWQPLASDLRFITTALKFVTDLERIGDLAVNISERVVELKQDPPLWPYVDLEAMSVVVREMIAEALDAFVTRDAARAEHVIQRDPTVDAYYTQTFRALLTYMMEDPRTIQAATRWQAIAKYLERMGDHATNLAEMVVFMVKGKDIRHLGKLEEGEAPRSPRGVLFVSTHNAARSQMAEGWARRLLPAGTRVASAGLRPVHEVSPHAVRVMQEVDIDISARRPKALGRVPIDDIDVIVNLSDDKIHVVSDHVSMTAWPIADPTAAVGTEQDILAEFRTLRDDLRSRIEDLASQWPAHG